MVYPGAATSIIQNSCDSGRRAHLHPDRGPFLRLPARCVNSEERARAARGAGLHHGLGLCEVDRRGAGEGAGGVAGTRHGLHRAVRRRRPLACPFSHPHDIDTMLIITVTTVTPVITVIGDTAPELCTSQRHRCEPGKPVRAHREVTAPAAPEHN